MEIKAHYRQGRKKPWEARWWVDRRMRSRFFVTEKERDRFIREFQREIGQHGETVFKFDKERMRRWQQADLLVPGTDPVAIAEFWLKHHKTERHRTVSEAMDAYLREMTRAGRDPEYLKHIQKALSQFTAQVSGLMVGEITSAQISNFLHELPFTPLTKRHYRTYLVTAFKWFMQQGWVSKNPASAVPAPKVKIPEPGILTVEETERLFHENEGEDPQICALLALGAFAGMRSSAIHRLSRDEIDFKNRAILTPAEKTKKGRRHFIEGLPENLWNWLECAPLSAFKMTPRQYAMRRENAFERAGLLVTKARALQMGIKPKNPPKNCLRHSFVSYHVALHRNPGQTALLISHKDQSILWEHYLGVATKEDAEKYFSILPSC